MAVNASTTASFNVRSSDPSSGSIPSGAPGSRSRPASFTISSWAVASWLASALRTSAAFACANRAAAPCTRSRTYGSWSLPIHTMSVESASGLSSWNSSDSSSSVG